VLTFPLLVSAQPKSTIEMASGAAYGQVQRARAAVAGKVAVNLVKLGTNDAKSVLVDTDLAVS
jgi:hypothetical protein